MKLITVIKKDREVKKNEKNIIIRKNGFMHAETIIIDLKNHTIKFPFSGIRELGKEYKCKDGSVRKWIIE
jgi:hypothetical protein